MKNKLLTLVILSSISTGLFAQYPINSDIKITANINSGCELHAEDIDFGELNDDTLKKSSSELLFPAPGVNTAYDAWLNIIVKCSKNTSYTLIGQSFSDNKLKGISSFKEIQYFLWQPNGSWFASDNGGFQGAVSNYFGKATGNDDKIKIYSAINMITYNNYRTFVPDTYSDTYTLTIKY